MDSTIKILSEIGIDVSSAIKRIGGNELLYINILKKFLKDDNYQRFHLSFAAKDFQTSEICIHTLKGIAANLGFIKLEGICKSILRGISIMKPNLLEQDISNLDEEYYKIIKILIKISQST